MASPHPLWSPFFSLPREEFFIPGQGTVCLLVLLSMALHRTNLRSPWQICSFLQRAKKCWIEHQYVPYAYKGEEWVGYDDTISFTHKVRPWFFLDPAYSFHLAATRPLSVLCVCACASACTGWRMKMRG